MGNPLNFDIFVGLVFLLFLLAGVFFGFRKMLVIFVTPLVANLLALLLYSNTRDFFRQFIEPPMLSDALVVGVLPVLSWVLVLVIMIRMRGARSAAGRVFGVIFSMAWAMLIVATVSLKFSLSTDMQEVRKSSITGPAVFAVGDALMKLLPDNPDDFFKKPEQPKQ